MLDDDLDLPTHPRTGLSAIGRRRNGEPIWPVAGGDGTADDPDPDGTDDPDPDGTDELGDAGKKAIDRMKTQLREEKRRRKAAEDKASAAAKPPDGDKPDLDEIRRQAREEAAAETLRERVVDKIEAKARKFADSEDAAAILLRSHQIDDFVDGGKIDTAAIGEALDELAEAKPHLLARQSGSGGSFDSGRGRRAEKGQLERADLKKMSSAEIDKARRDGRLDRLMGKPK